MTHIDLGVDEQAYPGIQGLLRYRPETAGPLLALADTLLHAPGTLTPGERELIAAHVSKLNTCEFCHGSHAAFATAQLPAGLPPVDDILADIDHAPLSAKVRALLHIATAVRESGRAVTTALVTAARSAGATDLEIHDTVLIAAAFSMFNRYVDGLATVAPDSRDAYLPAAHQIAANGYLSR
jgi:uncharacterized peroxidase-related enzyme